MTPFVTTRFWVDKLLVNTDGTSNHDYDASHESNGGSNGGTSISSRSNRDSECEEKGYRRGRKTDNNPRLAYVHLREATAGGDLPCMAVSIERAE
jgi:hypothetical protein